MQETSADNQAPDDATAPDRPAPAFAIEHDGAIATAPGALLAADEIEESGPPLHPVDVWSWTGRKYRIRGGVLLFVNFILFCGLCAFTHWLHVGSPFTFTLAAYLEPARFWGPQTQNLYDFILFPISVDQTPIYGVVVGLLFASIIAVPISVAILYRFPAALPFAAAVLVFAHLPWMSVALIGSCVLAAVRPFRLKFRYGSALLALLPMLVYLYMATRGPSDPLSASISPERRLLLAGPWLLAILAACTMLAVIIYLARVVNYRPGAVAPVMAVMFATPAVLFHGYVGVDELSYRVLEAEFGPRSARFQPVSDATDRILDLLPSRNRQTWRETARALMGPEGSKELDAIKARLADRLLQDLRLELMRDRRAAHEACTEFIADHPESRYLPNVLYIQAPRPRHASRRAAAPGAHAAPRALHRLPPRRVRTDLDDPIARVPPVAARRRRPAPRGATAPARRRHR
jgi:hypothetical protein